MKMIKGQFADYEYFEVDGHIMYVFQKNLSKEKCSLILDNWEIDISKEFYEAAKKEFCKEGDAK